MPTIILHYTIKHKYFLIMESDNEDDINMNLVMELEEATEMADEVQNHIEATNTNETLRDRLLKLPSPKVSVRRLGIASERVDQMILF